MLDTVTLATGDLGDVAHAARSSVRTLFAPKPLTVKEVFRTLHTIAKLKVGLRQTPRLPAMTGRHGARPFHTALVTAPSQGKGSQKQKQALVHKLIVSCRGPETRFLVRTLIANLRVGAVGLTTQVALAHAVRWHYDVRHGRCAAWCRLVDPIRQRRIRKLTLLCPAQPFAGGSGTGRQGLLCAAPQLGYNSAGLGRRRD